MTLPNFLIIGAAKSGTTAIYTYIKQHPEIFMTTPKELRYFSYNGPSPDDLNVDYIHQGVTTLQEYKRYFEGVKKEKIYGEASPMYMYYPCSPEKIKEVIPEVKMLAILRNPIDRAYSAYTHAIRDWKEPSSSFLEALEKEQERINAGWGILWHYTNAGFYYEQLCRYYEIFEPKQIKVVLYDDLVSDVLALMKEIFIFLNVNQDFKPETSTRPNVSGFPKKTYIHKFMKRLFIEDNLIKRFSRKTIPKSIRQLVMVKVRAVNLTKKTMPKEIRNQLIEVFYGDIKMLEKLINRDLSSWLL
jgi:hypothetical protein